jgi:hypothetical protein
VPEILKVNLSGYDFVPISTIPPLKLPGLSGVKVLMVIMLSSKFVGTKSN